MSWFDLAGKTGLNMGVELLLDQGTLLNFLR